LASYDETGSVFLGGPGRRVPPDGSNLAGCQINLSKVILSTISLAGAAWVLFRIIRRALFSWRLLNTFGDNQLLRFVKAPPSVVVEVAFIATVGILTACLAYIVLNLLSNRRRVGPHGEASSIPKFTSDSASGSNPAASQLRARPDDIARGEEESEKRRERELEKWREEHKAQLERE